MEREKQSSEPPGTEGARRATGVPGVEPAETGRWTSRAKLEVVLRILRGEDLDALSRELGVTAHRLAEWRDTALSAAQSGLKSRQPDHRDDEISRLRSKVGEMTMDLELYEALAARLDPSQRPPQRRPRS